MRYGHSFAVLAIASVVLSGCGLIGEGTGSAGGQEEKVNMQEAVDRAEQILDNTFAGIKPTVEAMRGPSTGAICPDIKGDATGAGTIIRRRYVMTIISGERRGSFLGLVERHWKKNGYEITSVRDHKERPAIFASTPDGFRVSLQIGYKGMARFDATSPCAVESRVTEPPRKPIDPDSEAAKGLPYIRSDFWSASTPLSSPSPGAKS